MEPARRGLFFEDFEVGREFRTPARTVTSTDIVNFACLSGDFNEVHANWEYCKSTPFGEPIAHGPLVYAIAGGLQEMETSLMYRRRPPNTELDRMQTTVDRSTPGDPS